VGVISLKDILIIFQQGHLCPRCWEIEDEFQQGSGGAEANI